MEPLPPKLLEPIDKTYATGVTRLELIEWGAIMYSDIDNKNIELEEANKLNMRNVKVDKDDQ